MPRANQPSGNFYEAKAPCLQCNKRIRREGYPSTVVNKRYCSIACRRLHKSEGRVRCCIGCGETKPVSTFNKSGKTCTSCYHRRRLEKLANEPHGIQWAAYNARCKYHKPTPIPFELTRPEFNAILDNACHYCGTLQAPRGLDRIDTDDSVGYLLTNVVPACYVCNRMRLHLPYEAYLAHVRQIVAHHPGPAAVYLHPEGLHPWVKASSGAMPGRAQRAK